jgi:hypothetical protein
LYDDIGEENALIYHGMRMTAKPEATPEQVEAALESMREHGRVIPAVKSFIVGRDLGEEYEWSAVYVLEDLDGYWEYLMHPAHARSDRLGLPLAAKFDTFDIADDEDPGLGAKIAALHQRRYAEDPGFAELIASLG